MKEDGEKKRSTAEVVSGGLRGLHVTRGMKNERPDRDLLPKISNSIIEFSNFPSADNTCVPCSVPDDDDDCLRRVHVRRCQKRERGDEEMNVSRPCGNEMHFAKYAGGGPTGRAGDLPISISRSLKRSKVWPRPELMAQRISSPPTSHLSPTAESQLFNL